MSSRARKRRPSNPLLDRAWTELSALAFVFTAVHFAVAGFFWEALPAQEIVPVTPHLRLYLVGGFEVLPALVLYAVDRVITARAGAGKQRLFRGVVLGVALGLVMRQLEIHSLAQLGIETTLSRVPLLVSLLRLVLLIAIPVYCVRHYPRLPSMVLYLAPVAVILATHSYFVDFAPDPIYDHYSSAAAEPADSRAPPVFIIMFDELSYDAMLGPDGRLDAARYPNFARLAGDSLTFTNATSNYFHTWQALPTMLDQTVSVAGQRDVRLYEETRRVEGVYATDCGVAYTCRGSGYLALTNAGGLPWRIALRAAYAVLPPDLESLGSRPLHWLLGQLNIVSPSSDPKGVHTFGKEMLQGFLSDVRSGNNAGQLYFFHTLEPHGPYVYGRDGNGVTDDFLYYSWANPASGKQAKRIADGYTQQTEYADTILGTILDTLQQQGIYDQATIYVSSDQGARRHGPAVGGPDPQVDDWAPHVPLLIKAPGIAPGETAIDYQLIDYGATLYDLLGLPAPSPGLFAGIAYQDGLPWASAFDPIRPQREKTFYVNDESEPYWKYAFDPASDAWLLVQKFDRPIGDRTREAARGSASSVE